MANAHAFAPIGSVSGVTSGEGLPQVMAHDEHFWACPEKGVRLLMTSWVLDLDRLLVAGALERFRSTATKHRASS